MNTIKFCLMNGNKNVPDEDESQQDNQDDYTPDVSLDDLEIFTRDNDKELDEK